MRRRNSASNHRRSRLHQAVTRRRCSISSAMSFRRASQPPMRCARPELPAPMKGGLRRTNKTGEGRCQPPIIARNGGDNHLGRSAPAIFGCRNRDGNLQIRTSSRVFATDDQIKMVELKIQPGRPSPVMAAVPAGGQGPRRRFSKNPRRGDGRGLHLAGPIHRAFLDAGGDDEVFIGRDAKAVRRQGRPGSRCAFGHPWEFLRDLQSNAGKPGSIPTFTFVVDGNEGGTGAAPVEFMDSSGACRCAEGVNFVHNALIGIGARDPHQESAPSGQDCDPALRHGTARWQSALTGAIRPRGFMFALGCIQSLSCHIPIVARTGVTTQDPSRNRALVVPPHQGRACLQLTITTRPCMRP